MEKVLVRSDVGPPMSPVYVLCRHQDFPALSYAAPKVNPKGSSDREDGKMRC